MNKVQVKARIYQCTACGSEKTISTNHKGSCFDYCPHCSWKANYAPSYCIPQHNHGRKFDYVREIPIDNQVNMPETEDKRIETLYKKYLQ